MNEVSTIISNYNYGEFVLDAIDSALNQYTKSNIIIVDDGSTDGSFNKIREYLKSYKVREMESGQFKNGFYSGPRKLITYYDDIVLISIENSGASVARNIGIDYVLQHYPDCKFFQILDADDMMMADKTNILLDKMKEFKEIGVVYGDYIIERPTYSKIELKEPYNKNILNSRCIVHSGAMIRKDYLQEVIFDNGACYDANLHGPGSKEFIGCTEDYDLWLRLSNTCVFCHVPKVLTRVRELGHNQSLKMTQEIFNQNMQIIQQR